MKIKTDRLYRTHGTDAGVDVYLPYDCTLQPGEIAKIPLGFGLEISDVYEKNTCLFCIAVLRRV